jgi:hypothetical protein
VCRSRWRRQVVHSCGTAAAYGCGEAGHNGVGVFKLKLLLLNGVEVRVHDVSSGSNQSSEPDFTFTEVLVIGIPPDFMVETVVLSSKAP